MGRGAGRLVVALALATALAPSPPRGDDAQLTPRPEDKCPVCGMFVSRYTDWIAAVRFGDGDRDFFDGAKDLFTFLLGDVQDGRGHRARDVKSVMVTDYYSLRQVDARSAWFVIGSDVLGPMGRELVPFADEGAAKEFLGDHHGKRILRFAEVTPAVLKELER